MLSLIFLLTAQTSSFDPAKRANELENERSKRVGEALKARKSGEIEKVEAEIAATALREAKRFGHDPIADSETLAWAQLYRVGKDYETERSLLARYLNGALSVNRDGQTGEERLFRQKPVNLLGAQMQYLMACFNLKDGKDLDRMLRQTKPAKGDAGSTLASYCGGTYHYAIRDALGPQAAIDALAYCAQFIPEKPFANDEARKSAGWARRQVADGTAAYLSELGRNAEAVATLDKALAELDADIFRVNDLKKAKRRYELIGKPIPSLPATDSHGTYTSLESLKGKVVILDFTAHWCHACIASLPSLNQLYRELHPKGVEVLSVTTYYGYFAPDNLEKRDMPKPEEFKRMPAWMAKYGVVWPMVYVNAQTMQAFGVSGIPQVMLIDKKGVLKSIDLGFSDAKFARFRAQVEEELKG